MTARLSRREALLVRELAVIPGNPVGWAILADAIDDTRPRAQYRVQATVARIRAKFGPDVIRTVRGSGYAL